METEGGLCIICVRVEWRREHDSYYPRDKYRDLLDYCGGRCRVEDSRLVIRDVRPEDKGVYRWDQSGGCH